MAWASGRLVYWVACICLVSSTLGQEWTPSTFPNPMVDVDKCGRGGKKSWICDPDGFLSKSVADHVEGELKKIYAGMSPFVTKPCGSVGWEGFQLAVAIMGTFHVPKGMDPAQQAEHMAKTLHDAWGVGNPACNNGILLLLAVHNRQVYLSTGAGALPYLNNRQAKAIIDNMKPHLRSMKYGEAVDEAVVNIGLALAGRRIKPKDDATWVFAIFAAVMTAIIGFSCYSGWKNSKRYKTCKERLEALKKDQQAIRENRYVARTCPICLDPFAPDGPNKAAHTDVTSKQAKVEEEDVQPSAPPLSASDEATPLLAGGASGASTSAGSEAGHTREHTFVNPLKDAKQPAGKKALYLRCGHGFCEPCIEEWMKTNKNSCPICRKDIDNDDPPLPNRPAPPPNCSSTYYQDVYGPEMLFRMRRMHYYYPDYITGSMLSSWEQDLQNQRDLNTNAMRQFELNDPATRSETTQMGSSGASSSWGGGNSSGGGGYGSSW